MRALTFTSLVLTALIATSACASAQRPTAAPSDEEMIRSFQEDRDEFEFWKNVFVEPDMSCRIEMRRGELTFAKSTCAIQDSDRLKEFMVKAGVITIDARKFGTDSAIGVQFRYFAEGFLTGHLKEILYSGRDIKPLYDNLDVYNWGLIKDPKQRQQGDWHRIIEDHWYLRYEADF